MESKAKLWLEFKALALVVLKSKVLALVGVQSFSFGSVGIFKKQLHEVL
ncbi:hypothetical protein BGP_2829 [Beggiatoa sp. PS]|nr:hypothetical protein BGP_2829 [Beggiatoa sp. PS]